MNESEVSKVRTVVGSCFVRFCQGQSQEFMLGGFASALKEMMPGATLLEIYRWGGAHEDNIYFTDTREANPQRYWRVTLSGTHFLLPKPLTRGKFDDSNRPKGFILPLEETICPESLRKMWPAILIGDPRRWEVDDLGAINCEPELHRRLRDSQQARPGLETPNVSLPQFLSVSDSQEVGQKAGRARKPEAETIGYLPDSSIRKDESLPEVSQSISTQQNEKPTLRPASNEKIVEGSIEGSYVTLPRASKKQDPGILSEGDLDLLRNHVENAYLQFCTRLSTSSALKPQEIFQEELNILKIEAHILDLYYYQDSPDAYAVQLKPRKVISAAGSISVNTWKTYLAPKVYWGVLVKDNIFPAPKVDENTKAFLDIDWFPLFNEVSSKDPTRVKRLWTKEFLPTNDDAQSLSMNRTSKTGCLMLKFCPDEPRSAKQPRSGAAS